MISRYHIRNYKCFADSGPVELGALTVLLGRNNSGKSSLLQPLQMLDQTLSSTDESVQLATHEPRDFGRYFEWVHRGDTSRDFEIELVINRARLAVQKLSSQREKPSNWRFELHLSFGIQKGEARNQHPFLKRVQVLFWPLSDSGDAIAKRRQWDFRLFASGKVEEALYNGQPVQNPALILAHCLPRNLEWDKPVKLFVSDYAVVQDPHYFYSLDKPFRDAIQVVSVAPIRPPIPRVFHGSDCDPRGGTLSTTAILESLFLLRSIDETAWEKFRKYLNHWLGDEAGFLSDIDLDVVDIKRELFSLVGIDQATGAKVNLADTGFGIAQVLPVLVQLYFARAGQVVVIEEPELHLNPAAQRVIADLAIDQALQGKQVIAETHSEHFLLRLRRRTVETPSYSEMIRVYYVERQKDQSVLRHLPITEDGRLENWPVGFLDEAFQESSELIRALSERKVE